MKSYNLIVVAVTMVAACASALATQRWRWLPPPIADDIKCKSWRDCREASERITLILNRQFVAGTPSRMLTSKLLAEGFHKRSIILHSCLPPGQAGRVGQTVIQCPNWDSNWNPNNELVFEWSGVPCGNEISVRWSADKKERLVHLQGYFDEVCL